MRLNIVFDKWDENNKPIKNLQYLDKVYRESAVIYPFTIPFFKEPDLEIGWEKRGWEEREWKLNECKLKDITPDENYYYIISHTYTYLCFIKNGMINLPIEVEYYIKHNNLKVIFMSPHESPEHLDIFVKMLTDKINKNNWKESNFYIISNNAMMYSVKNKLNSKINFFKTNASLIEVSNIKIKPIESDILYNKKFVFLCLNRRLHNHRVMLLTHLKNLNLLKDDIIDWSMVEKYNTNVSNDIYVQSIKHFKGYIDPNNKMLVNDYKVITSTKKLSYYEQNVNWFDSVGNFNQYEYLTLSSYKNSYINIVTESKFNFNENIIHITEKTFKPFYYFQIPIFLASHNHVKILRKEYEFYLFDDLIDHSYDDEIDDIKRFHMVIKEIQRLSTMREEISIYYKNNVNKIIHNHNIIKTYSERKIEENYFLNLINENK